MPEAEIHGRMFPIQPGREDDETLIGLLVSATRMSFEFYDLTVLGEPRVAIRKSDDWVRMVWANTGHEPSELTDNVLVMYFSCVPNGSVN
jgi:hypothetical protein